MKIILLVAAIVFFIGCNHVPSLDFLYAMEVSAENARQFFQPGDTVEVKTLDNTLYQLKIEKITDTHIVGQQRRIPFNEIVTLQRKSVQ